MILQNQTKGHPLVISQESHMNLAGELARVFGNDRFVPLAPHDEMMFTIENHDHGWRSTDDKLGFNQTTGLPFNLVETPVEELLTTGPRSVDYCQAWHPFSGLLVSMHTYGLYTGRYGMSDKIYVDAVSAKDKPAVEAMLKNELKRQEALREQLEQNETWKPWVTDEMLFYNYKRLQFFDTLSLYFNTNADPIRETSIYTKVPLNISQDVDIKVTPIQQGIYAVDPFPFKENGITISMDILNIKPQSSHVALGDIKDALPTQTETIKLVGVH